MLLGGALCRRRATLDVGVALLAALALQVGLGVANVLLSLQTLPLAAAQNAGAALLVFVMVWVNFRLGAPRPAIRRAAASADSAADDGDRGGEIMNRRFVCRPCQPSARLLRAADRRG
ncbi:hypothetical protein [Thauera humireducens]|uniref:hypothetical protein n=1 Tax=Thauera humireducens TaxID=1134435 RepID=UPI00311D8AFA